MTAIKTENIKFHTFLPSFKARVQNNQPGALPEDLTKILDKVTNASDYEQYLNIIDSELACSKDVEKIDDFTFKKGEYYIKMTTDIDESYQKLVLEGLKKKGINLAPELVGSAYTKEGFGLSVLKIQGTKSGALIDFEKGYRLLDPEAKKTAYKELCALTKLGIANLSVLNSDGLKITPDLPHRVVADNWSNLCPADEYNADTARSPRMELLQKIYEKIFKK